MSRRVGGVVAAALSCVLLAPVARASPGRQSWVASYNGPASSVDEAKAAVVSPDGTRVFVTGESAGFGTNDDYDYATVAYNAATGGQLWAARYDGPAHGLDEAGGIGVAPDGSKVFVTGYVSTTGSPEAATVAYDAATGSRVWVALYDGVGHGASAGGLGVSPDGSRVYISGDSYDGPPYYLHRYATVAYDAASGSLIWATRYARPGSDQNDAGLLQVSPDGSRVFVSGTTFASTAFDYTTVAYDASTGHALWASSYNGPGLAFDFPFSLAVSPDGSKVFATGYSDAPNTGDDYATVAWDAVMGHIAWTRRYHSAGDGEDVAESVAVSADSRTVFVTGWAEASSTSYDWVTFAYDASTGGTDWLARFDSPAHASDYAYAVGVTPDDSKVVVTGTVFVGPASQYDSATLVYAARTGSRLSVETYGGSANGLDQSYALAVSPVGNRVYSAGTTWDGDASNYDYLTIAYRVA